MTTSPYYPQANGFIERSVQTVKNLLQKCKESGADPHLAMLCLHSTPLDHNIALPGKLLNSRVYHTNIPNMSKPSLSLSADGDNNAKPKRGKVNRNHRMIGPPRPYLPCTPMIQYAYLIHTTANRNLAMSSAVRILLAHMSLPWLMAVPLGRTAVTFGQQERRSVSSATAPVMNCQWP